jgi:orotate phosphoribosyltransferase
MSTMPTAELEPQRSPGALNLFDETRLRLADAEALRELRDDLMRVSFQRRDVRLDSGVQQPYFFDKYLMASRPSILRRLARFLAAEVPAGTDRLAAPTLGAVAFGTAVSLETGLPLAVVRTHWDGTRGGNAVEGGLHRGETVVLIEDVVVSGSRALHAVEQLRSVGATMVAVVAAIDCERGADAAMAGQDVDYVPLFRFSDFSSTRETP